MFATRNTVHNENAVHEQQTAAAAKPLNQGVKGLAPKTPGNKTAPKTPFKIPLNDENAAFGGGKTGGKGKEGGLFAGKEKGAKVERSAFVTPAGPRTARAPLGNKTTNVKAAAFQTPAPPATQEKQSARNTSPRLRRAKVKVHQAEADPLNDESEVPDIEYMPPREVPLPDYPDDCWPHDRTYPQFEGKNFTRGWLSAGRLNGGDDDADPEGMDDFHKKMEELVAKEREEAKVKKVAAMKVKPPSTLQSKTAASALSSTSKPTGQTPSFAKPTAAARARMPAPHVLKKPSPLLSSAPGNARHIAAKAASNTTLGYSKGRAVSATTRAPALMDVHRPKVSAAKASPTKMPFGGGTTLDDLLGLSELDMGEGEDQDEDGPAGLGAVARQEDEEDDEFADFQLEPVQL